VQASAIAARSWTARHWHPSPFNASAAVIYSRHARHDLNNSLVAKNIKSAHSNALDEGQALRIRRRLADQLSLTRRDSVNLVSRAARDADGTTPPSSHTRGPAVVRIGMSQMTRSWCSCRLPQRSIFHRNKTHRDRGVPHHPIASRFPQGGDRGRRSSSIPGILSAAQLDGLSRASRSSAT